MPEFQMPDIDPDLAAPLGQIIVRWSTLEYLVRKELGRIFSLLPSMEKIGREQGLAIENIYDAAVACWSAARLAGALLAGCRVISCSTGTAFQWQFGFEFLNASPLPLFV